MLISIVIPNYNGRDLLAQCLLSIINQSYKRYEIIVVDNASKDNSAEILNEYSSSIKVKWLGENIGFSRAVNLGIKESSGELIFVLNNDTVLDSECLAHIIAGVKTHSAYGFYAPMIREQDNPLNIYAVGLMYSPKGYGNRSQRYELQGITEPTEVFGACGAAALYRRNVLDEVGLFNEDFFFLHEDIELSFRHQLFGYKCLFLPSAVIYHKGSATLHKFFDLAVKETVKNSLYTVLTCMPGSLLSKYRLSIAKFHLSFWLTLARKGYLRETIRSILSIASSAADLLQRRRNVQGRSKVNIGHLEALLYRGPIYINFPGETIKL